MAMLMARAPATPRFANAAAASASAAAQSAPAAAAAAVSPRSARRSVRHNTPLAAVERGAESTRQARRQGQPLAAHVAPGRLAPSSSPETNTAPRQPGGAADHPPAPAGRDDFAAFEAFVAASQDRILLEAERLDGSGKTFLRDRWERPQGGGYGVTAVLEGGDLFEKAAANVTIVRGVLSPQRAQSMSGRGRAAVDPRGGQRYGAAALSLVFHPAHPHVPTLRADVRLFQVFADGERGGADDGSDDGNDGGDETASEGDGARRPPPLSWYGGGCDLTPALLHESDARDFHAHWKGVCDAHVPDGGLYAELKSWCDAYFYVRARSEHRGVGGVFFDDLERWGGGREGAGGGGGVAGGGGRQEEGEMEEQAGGARQEGRSSSGSSSGSGSGSGSGSSSSGSSGGAPASAAAARRGDFDPAALARDVLANVLPSWSGIAARRRAQPFTEAERAWQLRRRGRYIEFNLLDDRGVRFGLADGKGRVESIMVSAPPLVSWSGYGEEPAPGSREAATLELLRGAPREWV